MSIRVLIVDDSSFIVNRLSEILLQPDAFGHRQFEVVGRAANGLEAVRMCHQLQPDVITMDVEMPLLDGIGAVKKIMSERPTPILMFSALTQADAQLTFDALDAGALDYLPKQLDKISSDHSQMHALLRARVKTVALQAGRLRSVSARPVTTGGTPELAGYPKLILIAASTGGPVALQAILTRLPARCQASVVIIQHMPAQFTQSFAARLDQQCAIEVRQASQSDILRPGLALLAPGGMQLGFVNQANSLAIDLRAKAADELYSPSADIAFASASEHARGKILAVVLTGMGADGRVGAGLLKRKGATVWAQNEQSCTVFGMPKAVIEAGVADTEADLNQIGAAFSQL